MLEPTFDKDGYPTDETLQAIREWPYGDMPGLFEFIRQAWEYEDMAWEENDGIYKISTCGWSGNESLIDALGDNFVAWMQCWYSSTRGGHYVFALPGTEID